MEDENQNRKPVTGEKKQSHRESSKNQTILVVDDEELIRILTESFLEQLGYQVLLADCGEQAITIFKAHQDRIQLVLSDITMPGIDGIETAKQLRAIDPELKLIISSGYSSEKSDTLPDRTVFLAKPYSISDLEKAINKLSE